MTNLPARAEAPVHLYAFANSLVHHASETEQTAMPYWLVELARADGKEAYVDGRWGFLRNFARELPPPDGWFFGNGGRRWSADATPFGKAGFTHVLITPSNFSQYQPPDADYEDNDPVATSPLATTLEVIDWIAAQAPGTPVLIYEGWPDMGRFARIFPPKPRALGRYHAYTLGEYHQWYLNYLAGLQEARPELDIRLLPIARILSQLFTATPLSGLTAEALYLDDAPHGTPTLYLLAAMISYAELFGKAPPQGFIPPDSIDPLLRDHYGEIVDFIAAAIPPKPAPAEDKAEVEVEVEVEPGSNGAGAPGNPSLAMNLNGIADWSTQHPFLDLMKTARPWLGHKPGEWGAYTNELLARDGYLDEQGWPTALPEDADRLEAILLTEQPEAAVSLSGRYRLSYDGLGEIEVLGRVSHIRREDGEIWFDYAPGDGLVSVALTAIDPDDPVRNIRILRADHIPLDEAGALFNPHWIARIRDLRVLRFMDWMEANHSPQVDWLDRPRLNDAGYTRRGVPVEVMIELANEVGADAWFTMPHKVDDTYVRAFAEYVRDNLDSRLKAYVEYSNETWNLAFEQAHWMGAQARKLWGEDVPGDAWMQYAGMRAAQVAGIWHGVFGDEADARLVRVIAVHTGWPGLEKPLLETPQWRQHGGGYDPSDSFDAYAVTGYFGFELSTEDFADEMQSWLDQGYDITATRTEQTLRDGSLKELMDELWPYHANVAAAHGLTLIMYEGGTHLVGLGPQAQNADLTAFFARFNYSQAMAGIYRDLLDGWRAAGGTLFNAFVDVAKPTQWGSWGALRHLDDDNPRWQVLAGDNRDTPGWWEERQAGSFAQGATRMGSADGDVLSGTAEEDSLIGQEGDDILISNGGNDRLHGGDGLDSAVLPGKAADYAFTVEGQRIVARSSTARVQLVQVELIQFTADPGQIIDTAALP